MQTEYKKKYPAIRIDDCKTHIWHNHPESYNTSYLYNSSLTDGEKMSYNNMINENRAKLKSCMGFFKVYADGIIKNPDLIAPAASALEGDQALFESLTHKNI